MLLYRHFHVGVADTMTATSEVLGIGISEAPCSVLHVISWLKGGRDPHCLPPDDNTEIQHMAGLSILKVFKGKVGWPETNM